MKSRENLKNYIVCHSVQNVTRLDYFGISDIELELLKCKKNSFLCENSQICINVLYVCDNRSDCPYGEDEKNCTQNEIQLFYCKNSSIAVKFFEVCDSVRNCPDNLDEKYCFSNKK